ncbi:MAG: AMP-binding protein [Bacteroidaceae bacterium]|nr:AMP-binding protein [Bacteroidaceae bacterium]
MDMLYKKLWQLHIMSLGGLLRWAECIMHEGFTLMALMRFAAHYYPDRTALVDGRDRFSYRELYEQSTNLSKELTAKHGLRSGMGVSMYCPNTAQSVIHLFALSRLGLKIKLMELDSAPDIDRRRVKMFFRSSNSSSLQFFKSSIFHSSSITTFTGGTSGNRHEATRPTSACQFLPPLFALLRVIGIDCYDSVFMPLPLFHGFGLATIIVAFLMGKKVCIMSHFDSDEALDIIRQERVEVLTLVPAMLARLWQRDGAESMMQSVRCIISGGDRLDRKWVDTTRCHLGDVLYNLYGTSEAGFFMIATPGDLSGCDEIPIGRPIDGVKCRVEADGALWVRGGWAMKGLRHRWQNTGDLVHKSDDGLYYHRGRADRMVVCGGENVYADHVESVVGEHPDVAAAVVYPVPDTSFGTVLHADVEVVPHSILTPEALQEWLQPRLARAERPHHISFRTITLLDTGKKKRQN